MRTLLPAALAAGVVCLVLSYPVFLGVWELPRVREQSGALLSEKKAAEERIQELTRSVERSEEERGRVAGWSGPIMVPLLAAPLRSGSMEEIAISVARGQPFVCLAADLGIPDEKAESGNYVVEVLRPEGTAVWSMELDASEARRQMTRAGSLAFLIPAEKLPPGRYRLRIARAAAGEGRGVLEASFAIVQGE